MMNEINYTFSERNRLLTHLLVGLATLFGILTYYRFGIILTVFLVTFSLVLIISHLPNNKVIVYYVAGGLIFPFCEILVVNTGMFGIWSYMYNWDAFFRVDIGIFGVPIWLFPAWGIVTVIIRATPLNWLKEGILNKITETKELVTNDPE